MALPPGLPGGLGGAPGGAPGGPPQLGAPPANLGGASVPQGNPGNVAAALSAVRNAVRMLQTALPNIPMGSPLHDDLLNAVGKLSKHMGGPGQTGGMGGLDMQSLLQAARQQAQQMPMGALQRMFPQQPNAPPAMPGGGGMTPAGPTPGGPPGGGPND